MKLHDILESYDTVVLDQISADTVDEVVNLRLPQTVIVQEIIGALTSQSYISSKIQYGRPPTYTQPDPAGPGSQRIGGRIS